MAVLLLFAFVSGLITIAAPCIWPLLPIVLSSSSLGGRRRPLGVTLGVLLSFGILTLSISYLVHLFGLDASLLRKVSVVVLIVMGVTLLFPALGGLLEASVSRLVGNAGWSKTGSGFWPGFVSGLPLGVVWAPCAGPILATIATLSATRSVGPSIVLVTIAYLVGIGIPLLAFSYAGHRFIQTSKVLSKYTGVLQRGFGVVIVMTAALVLFNWDTALEADLVNFVPSYTNLQNKLETNSNVTNQLDKLKDNPVARAPVDNSKLFYTNFPAPELAKVSNWLDLPAGQTSLSLKQLRGKVVLVDFWTYTCINCIRTLPHVTSWYDKYKDDGFVVIGVHTPEFAFEHDTGNVQRAIGQFGIHYPVAQDNDFGTWKAFNNQYWPADYLIDANGIVRRVGFGEGDYDDTEGAIRELLMEAGADVTGAPATTLPDQTPTGRTSPETYLGSARMQFYYPAGSIPNGNYTSLKSNPKLSLNSFDFAGGWTVQSEYSQAGAGAVLEDNFQAEHVYLVMHKLGDGNATVKVKVDGRDADGTNAGADVQNATVTVDSDRLYDLVDLKGSPGKHVLHLEVSPGVQVFAFTFG